MVSKKPESEWLTRKRRIDPKLNAVWILPLPGAPAPLPGAHRSEEEPTANGPADDALWLDGAITAVIEAKRVTIGPRNVLTQAERYSRGISSGPYNVRGFHCPFLYATNGELLWFPRRSPEGISTALRALAEHRARASPHASAAAHPRARPRGAAPPRISPLPPRMHTRSPNA